MARRNANFKNIDSEKLLKLIKDKGLTPTDVSKAIGKSEGFLNSCMNRGTLDPVVCFALDKLDICETDYVIDKKAVKSKKSTSNMIVNSENVLSPNVLDSVLEQLYDCISSAIYDGIHAALDETTKNVNA